MQFSFSNNDIKDSLIPTWNFNTNNIFLPKHFKFVNKPKYTNFKEYVVNEFNKSNTNNDLSEQFNTVHLEIINNLNDYGVNFEFGFINILINDVIFPICDIGKNRSQFMFYYLKNIQFTYNNFLTGYPSSGDELKTIIDNSNSNSILSGFKIQYKSDNFSKAMSTIFNNEISRSVHIFDILLKKKENYNQTDLKNYEEYKYEQHNYQLFDKSKDYFEIQNLFKKYFLNPQNIRNIIDKNINYKITYLCLSSESFYNMCNLLNFMKNENPFCDLKNIRIVYFGIKDIFQGSAVKNETLNNFIEKIKMSTFFE